MRVLWSANQRCHGHERSPITAVDASANLLHPFLLHSLEIGDQPRTLLIILYSLLM